MWRSSGRCRRRLRHALADIAGAVRLLAERNRVIARGPGDAVAAALAGRAGSGKIVCVCPAGTSIWPARPDSGRRAAVTYDT